MPANNKQVGGGHYQGEYQHWDFVCDVNMHYLLGCATKYLVRWREKNGVEDLKKAIHYVEKAEEKGVTDRASRPETTKFVEANKLANYESIAFFAICGGRYETAKIAIGILIEKEGE